MSEEAPLTTDALSEVTATKEGDEVVLTVKSTGTIRIPVALFIEERIQGGDLHIGSALCERLKMDFDDEMAKGIDSQTLKLVRNFNGTPAA